MKLMIIENELRKHWIAVGIWLNRTVKMNPKHIDSIGKKKNVFHAEGII